MSSFWSLSTAWPIRSIQTEALYPQLAWSVWGFRYRHCGRDNREDPLSYHLVSVGLGLFLFCSWRSLINVKWRLKKDKRRLKEKYMNIKRSRIYALFSLLNTSHLIMMSLFHFFFAVPHNDGLLSCLSWKPFSFFFFWFSIFLVICCSFCLDLFSFSLFSFFFILRITHIIHWLLFCISSVSSKTVPV